MAFVFVFAEGKVYFKYPRCFVSTRITSLRVHVYDDVALNLSLLPIVHMKKSHSSG
jgi:hypothetical protein